MTAVVRTREELARARAAAQGSVAVVMTMGALHEGHATLLREARKSADFVLATIFVNPLQFGPNEDLARYPRTFDADLAVCAAEGVDLVFAPTPEVMYPHGQPQVTVHPGPLGEVLEGAVRPGHFAGVLTVVGKLLRLTRPDLAFFGEKDYQQLTLITLMVRDLELGVEIVGVPTVREPDGLALSSRNRYLSEAERETALALSRGLRAGAARREAAAVLAAARAELAGVDVDYLALRGTDLSEDPGPGEARLLVAARVGTTRLIDNLPVHLDTDGTATKTEGESA
ncbi:pantoate--beta-alanine ligase [Catellatospora citrea]|uniref:Pantothenate synthetase n=1 Tax=Catellatospora citrea TaxID=53366 RepID=A0A8J3P3E0_9ACTN|nr:pantoate--beta-alanine ligase [Catellatospora citrea]RKE08635.1 pantothenate synthetase [Catellatospora citrea]GIG02551.1 pantothenate synthetase [Catellatospora citrea]